MRRESTNRKQISLMIMQSNFKVAKGVRTMGKRDAYKYHLKRGNKIIRSGITNDLDRREREHQREHGKNVHITKVGNATTREGARDWEKDQKRGTP